MIRFISLSIFAFLHLAHPAFAAGEYDNVQIKAVKVAEGVHMLQGAGGNIGVSAGADGVFMIDDQFSPLTPKILAAIGEITDKPVKFLINTHWHFDHTGGNENLGKQGVVCVATDNVCRRPSPDPFMEAFNRAAPAAPEEALPVISFNDKATFHLNGQHIQARHFPHAHTDGDSALFFKEQNVIHTGDIFFNGFYPFIDAGAGGSIYGMIDAAAAILTQADDKTKIIPGHGPLATREDRQAYHDMLVQVVAAVTPLAKRRLSPEEAIKADPLKNLNEKWGGGFLKPDVFIGLISPTIVSGRT